MFLLHVAKKL